jgi:hypothetical protein
MQKLAKRIGITGLSALAITLALTQFASNSSHAIDRPRIAPPSQWRDLQQPNYLYPGEGAIYYTFTTKNGSKAHLLVVNYKSGKWTLRPFVNDGTAAVSETGEKFGAGAAVNGGYFNLSDGVSTSYVTIDAKEVANPKTNEALIKNPKLANFLETIFNRSEIRFLEDKKHQTAIDIAPHNASLPEGTRLVNSLQAGPQLLPKLTDKEEAFVRTEPDGKEVDAVSALKPAARTAFGITDDGNALLLCISGPGQDEGSPGLTLKALADLMASLGCTKAINLDGGTSTSMYVRIRPTALDQPTAPPQGKSVVNKTPETKVKSALLVLPGRS